MPDSGLSTATPDSGLDFPPDGGVLYTSVDGIAVGDLNGDGNEDIAVAVYYQASNYYEFQDYQGIAIFFGDGGGGFSEPTLMAVDGGVGGLFQPLAIDDLNGDGRADLITGTSFYDATSGCYEPGVVILFADEDGGFLPPTILNSAICGGLADLLVADINSDGRAEIVLLSNLTGPLIFSSQPDGGFTMSQPLPPGIPAYPGEEYFNSLAVGDVNGDGRDDLIITIQPYYFYVSTGELTTGELVILLQGDGGELFLGGDYPLSVITTGVFAAAIGGNDTIDLTPTDTALDVVAISPDAGLVDLVAYPLPAQSLTSMRVADFNRDGLPDLLVADEPGLFVLLGRDGGAYESAIGVTGALDAFWTPNGVLTTADLNGDGRADIVATVGLAGQGNPYSFLPPAPGSIPLAVEVYMNVCSPSGMGP